LKSFKFPVEGKETSISLPDGRELWKVANTEESANVFQVGREDVAVEKVSGGKDLNFWHLLFLESYSCVKYSQAQIGGLFSAELKLNKAHFQQEVSKGKDRFGDTFFFTFYLKVCKSGLLSDVKIQSHQNFTFHHQKLICRVGLV
jgi:hypothetical protein